MATEGSCRITRKGQSYSACCRGGLPCRLQRPHPDDGEEDRISCLPDDLLLQVLARLRCARAAAHTGLLARRWRSLWTRLPELTFHSTAPDPLHAAVSLLDIRVDRRHNFPPARIPSLLVIRGDFDIPFAVELPCFHRTTSIRLTVFKFRFTLPPTGEFKALESLSFFSCDIGLADMLPRCPRLRKLRISNSHHPPPLDYSPLAVARGCIPIDSFSVSTFWPPSLKKLRLVARLGLEEELTLSYSAPIGEELSWQCACPSSIVGFGQIRRLSSLILSTPNPLGSRQLASDRNNTCLQPQRRPHVHVLSFCLGTHDIVGVAVRSIEQLLSQFLVANFAILELNIAARGHVYGAMVLHLLGFRTAIQRLNVKLNEEGEEACSVNCPCDQPTSWRSQSVSLTALKEVEIQGFKGEDHKIDLLKVIFRSATMLERQVSFGTQELYRNFTRNSSISQEKHRIQEKFRNLKGALP
uniref:FBD domain-containing protein n=1 Tax=Arundo donax TaxID=35708 RepID=A0A0A8XT24_ARUDO